MATLGRTKLTSLALLLAGMLGAQTIQLKQADRFTVVNLDGRSVTKLRGRVKLASAEGIFTCDSADWYRGENRLFAFNSVRFVGREGLVIRSRALEYLNGESYFSGGVTASEGDQTLITSSLRYSTSTQNGIFSNPAELRTKDGTLTCQRGDFTGGSYRFVGDVRWSGANERLYSEQMNYESEQKRALLPLGGSGRFDQDTLVFGGGTLNLSGTRSFDFTHGVQGWGPSRQFSADRFQRWSDADRSEWTGAAYLADWEGDSTELWADLLTTTPDSINAHGNASVAMTSWSGRAERWRGHRRDSIFVLEGSPVVWSEDYQIIAKQFTMSQEGPGDSLWANEGVHLGEASDSSGRCNQMAAESMRARILMGRMQRMDLETNAEALFYPEAGPASRMKSGRIELWFKSEGGIDELRFYPSPSGSAVNESEPSYLPGYADRWGERPSRTAAMSGLK